MDTSPSRFYVFNTHEEAEEAIQALHRSGFDVKKLSLVGRGYHSEENPVGFYTTGDKVKSWGRAGAFWGGIWGLLFAPAVFFLPGLGLIGMAGPFVVTLMSALEGAVVVGGTSALCAALTQLGATKEQAIRYETAIKSDKYMLLIHANAQEIAEAHAVLANLQSCQLASQ